MMFDVSNINGTSIYSIYFPIEEIRLPLKLKGPVSYIQVRYPTDEELGNSIHLHMTNRERAWEPCVINID